MKEFGLKKKKNLTNDSYENLDNFSLINYMAFVYA